MYRYYDCTISQYKAFDNHTQLNNRKLNIKYMYSVFKRTPDTFEFRKIVKYQNLFKYSTK
jgi:hypothetical protein